MTEKFTQVELVKAITEAVPELSGTKAKMVVDTLIETVKDAVIEGRDVTFNNFISLKVTEQKGREGVSALTGKPYKTEDRRVVKIKPLPAFKKAVEEGK